MSAMLQAIIGRWESRMPSEILSCVGTAQSHARVRLSDFRPYLTRSKRAGTRTRTRIELSLPVGYPRIFSS